MKATGKLTHWMTGLLSLVLLNGASNAFAVTDTAMPLHHIHVAMLNHGLGMATQGSNLIMLTDMAMTTGVDAITHKHGHLMFKRGKELIQRAMRGKEMQTLHRGRIGEPMKYTHSLGEAMVEVVDILEDINLILPTKHTMAFHHMHMALNHALDMATRGGNLIMLGWMGMAPEGDEFSVEHGKEMIAEARALWKQIVEGEEMKKLMAEGQSKEMAKTHELAEAGMKVIDQIAQMPGVEH